MPQAPASIPDLARIFEPVREQLERVEREFARHLESRVELIPEMGKYVQMSGGKRNEPSFLPETCAVLAAARGATPVALADQIARNFADFVGGAK